MPSRHHGMQVLLCGGRSALELEYAPGIERAMQHPCRNLVGQDTLVEFLATLSRATALLSPDSGPAHMATTVGTPVIGLYAATNPERSGPTTAVAGASIGTAPRHCKFAAAPPRSCPGPKRSNSPGVMDLIDGGRRHPQAR